MARPKSKRYAAQQPKPILARFDIAQTTRENRNHWAGADALSAIASLSPGVRRVIRIRSRYEAFNNSWYSGILRTASNHIVGNGPRLQVLTGNSEANKRLERAFAAWAKTIRFADVLRTMCEAYWRDGEVFAMKSARPVFQPINIDIRVYESEQVASPIDGSIIRDNYIDDGVRFDEATNEISYYVLRRHPGGTNTFTGDTGDWHASKDVLHLFRQERPGQVRGIPRATPALQILPIMRRQELATLYTAESAANFAMYLKSNSPAIDPSASPADFAEIEMARNMLTTLPAGWDIGQVEPKQPGPVYQSFQEHTLKSFSRCTNMPYPLAAGTAEKSNFSSFKGDMRNVWRPEVIAEQNRIEESIVEHVFRWFCEAAIYEPRLLDGMPPIGDIEHKWHWPPLPDIDPADTANTAMVRVASGQASLTQIHAEHGQDWETEAQRAADDFGVDIAAYKAAVFFKTFGVEAGAAPGQPAAQQTPQGEYTQINQRAFTNNIKRIRSTLDQLISGDIGRVMAEQTLASIGLSQDRIDALINDAMDGQISDPNLQESQA